jgi:16S rRNA A1518/A1519 N6-dimethyltransferase RsmA/KsgA/DIM1 with predicted DNA glycosylase/AP lyase activity
LEGSGCGLSTVPALAFEGLMKDFRIACAVAKIRIQQVRSITAASPYLVLIFSTPNISVSSLPYILTTPMLNTLIARSLDILIFMLVQRAYVEEAVNVFSRQQ